MRHLFNLRVISLAIIVMGVLILALWLRASSGEDTWICVDGQWTRHGNPSAPMPQVPCTQATIPSPVPSASVPPTSADQIMTSFASEDFSFSYPDWPVMDQQMILEPERTKVAVSNAGCALVVTVRSLPPRADFQAAMDELLSTQMASANVRILQKNITEDSSHVEGEFGVQSQTIHSDQYGYVTTRNQFYSIVFAATKEAFNTACKPVIRASIKTVQVK